MHYDRLVLTILLTALGACVSPAADEFAGSRRGQIEAHQESRLVIASAALENGPPWFGAKVQAEITERTPLHAWTFELSGAASATFATQGTATGPDVDTVLYLYRWGTRGWGGYLARNDDHDGMVFSSLSRKLQAGRYRIVVKGRTSQVAGPFALRAECSGEGCPVSEQPSECVFGQRVTDMAAYLRVSNIMTVTSPDQLPHELARQQLVEAGAQVAEASVGTASELFARVDGGLVRWMRVWADEGGRQFTAYEFRIADGSYGAIFDDASGDVVARVNGAAVVDCRLPVGRCLLGTSYEELQRNPGFETLSNTTLDVQAARSLSELEQAQLLEAMRVAYADAEDMASAFASVDGNQVGRLVLREIASGRPIIAYEYSAGENSYGSVFAATDLAPIARIEDGALSACTWFE